MSIKNEIERLQNAKNGIASAITRKGVSVPEGVKLDGMEELIDGIETGVDTSDATASSNEILLGETAYVDGVKVTGTIETFDGSYTCSGESTGGGEGEDVTEETEVYTEKLTILENAITALENELEGKASAGAGPKLIKVYHSNLSFSTAYYINADYEIVNFPRDTEADVLGGIILYWGFYTIVATGDYVRYDNIDGGSIIKFNTDNGHF
jgi:hypothetical protein